jgi:hypothetical protein
MGGDMDPFEKLDYFGQPIKSVDLPEIKRVLLIVHDEVVQIRLTDRWHRMQMERKILALRIQVAVTSMLLAGLALVFVGHLWLRH